MMKIFYLLILATPSLLYSQSLVNSGSYSGNGAHGRAASGFEFMPEVTILPDANSAPTHAIEPISFTGKVFNGAMELEWTMATETNNRHFIIERSLDGLSFDAVGKINAAKLNGAPTDYSFIDDGILHTITYYRLKQTDLKGNSSYSATISVSLARQKKNENVVSPASNNGIFRTELPFSPASSDY